MRNRKGNKKMRFLARIISLLLVVILVSEEFLGSGNIVLAAPQDEISVVEDVSNENDTGSLEGALPEEGQEEDSSEEPQILFEVEGLREEGTKQFRLSDGTIMAAEYGMDVHYKDENDEWQDIDNRFRYEAADGDSPEGFVTAEGAVQFKFAPEISDGEVVRATSGEYSVGFSLRSGRGENGSEAILEEDGAAGAAGILLEDGETVPAGETENNLSQDEELLSSPITFIKGDILNREEAAEVLAELSEGQAEAVLAADVSAEDTVQAEDTEESSTLEAAAEELPEVVWAGEFAQEDAASGEEETLLEQASADNAVTSVGYGNILPGVSLQYVAYGSSLKEYILINEVQEDYHYEFDLDLENLVPQMQEDGNILLKDAENGTAVYEIPAAYMTDGAGCYSDAVEMVLLENGDGGYLLAVDADPEWIEAEERVFPVQIDPTLNRRLSSTTGIRGNYVCDAKETESSANYGWMYVGYDSSGNGNMTTFIQLKDLPSLPEGSVICSSMFNMYVVSYSQSAWTKMHVLAREVTSETSWSSAYTFKTRPSVSSEILDYRTITSGSVNSYVGWNITELVKEHYESGNASGDIFAFSLEACGTMSSTKCANTALNLTWDGAEPVLQIFYRDTRGVEGYYTYQVQDLGNAGTGYVGDYTSQLTVSKTAASYASSIFPYSLDLVYNSASSGSYFSKIGDIHTTDYSGMILGTGWKLSAQETVVAVSVEDLESTTTYLAYNDGDGTEHYFKRSDSDSTKYEDEDGLNLTIKKSGTTYTMTDKQDNVKTFKKGFLTNIKDANGNQMHIVYNGNAYTSNTIKADGTDRITSVVFQPKSGTVVTVFSLEYDSSGCLSMITDTDGRAVRFTYNQSLYGYQLVTVERCKNLKYQSSDPDYSNWEAEAEYRYDLYHAGMVRAYDAESGSGVQYDYETGPTGHRISAFHEYAASSVDASQTAGVSVKSVTEDLRRTTYTDSGTDRTFGTGDDVATTYLFSSAGQTVNAESEDSRGTVLGVTASAYEKKNGTSKKNNRMSSSISSGQAGVNLLANGGFEKASSSTEDRAEGWDHWTTTGSAARRGTDSGVNYSGDMHYNMFNGSTSSYARISQNVKLTAGETYTFSAYVNTGNTVAFGDGGGVYLEADIPGVYTLKKSTVLSHKTDAGVDGGWQRISVTFVAPSETTTRMNIYWKNAYGILYVDDVQLEKGDAATRFNHVFNGNFESAADGWTISGSAAVSSGEARQGNASLSMTGAPDTSVCAEQTIPIGRSSDTTFLLSGWGKGVSIPDTESSIVGKTDTSLKYWGMTLTLNYTDGTCDTYDLPFSDYVRDWQYAAMAVAPKSSGKTIGSATLRLFYQANANTCCFDSISLTEEPAQTYRYDDNGNLVSVQSSGNGEEGYSYDSTTQNLMSVATAGSGKYEYEYNNSSNKHLPTTVKNDTVSMDISYDANGQATGTTLKSSTDSLTMTSTAVYSAGLLASVTDNTGAKTSYTYDSRRRTHSVTDAGGHTTYTGYEDVWDRPVLTYQSGLVSLEYAYGNGNLTQISRGGYITADGDKQVLSYKFAYDSFGNLTRVSAGSRRLVDYTYNEGNGTLDHIQYGYTSEALASIYYGYDDLDRMTSATYRDFNSGENTVWGYGYSSDGNLATITKDGETVYTYDYDTLGRLIHSSALKDGETVLYTDHQYDTSDRILSQRWQIGEDGFSEDYTYNGADGTLMVMTSGGDALNFGYDSLKRLSSRSSPVLRLDYDYRALDGTVTTTQVERIRYRDPLSGVTLLPALSYAYDAGGNITSVAADGGDTVSYSYDAQNQLVSESSSSEAWDYAYDTYGNIRSITRRSLSGGTESTISLEYCSGDGLDMIKSVSCTDSSGTTVSGTYTYDAMGNPLRYFNGDSTWNLTWKYGRYLSAASDGTDSISYTYDADGIRQTKTVNGTEHEYVTLDGKVVRETYGTTTVDYFYDNEGKPYKISVDWGGTVYTGYYALNQQGDVIAILNDSGAAVVRYSYNGWGYETGHTTSTVTGLRLYQYNCLKYRGYYHDTETGFYYVSSRYYDPVIGRFISADTTDVLLAEHQNFLQYNLYTYCFNNPANMQDDNGEWPSWATKIAIGTAVIAAAAVLTVATAGTGTALACFAVGALKGSIAGAAMGAASGAVSGTINHRLTTGSWKGAGKAALDGAADGYMSGAISGFITGGINSSACFVAGTAILTSIGYVAIENIRAGDMVWAEDLETGEKGLKEVVQTFVNETDELVHVYVNGEEIVTTPEHPFYVPTKGWIGAVHLRAGDILLLQSGKYVIVEMIQHEILESPITVYNFEVEDFHTYYVGESSVLVHNACFDPKANSSRVAVLKNGSRAYLQDAGEHAGKYIAKDTARHANSAYKIFGKSGNKALKLLGDLDINGNRIWSKHSSNAGKLYEVVKWITRKK